MNQRIKPKTVPAYFYGERTVCSLCTRDIVVPFYRIADSHRHTELILDEAAAMVGIDRSDETTFSSYQFPKTIAQAEIIPSLDACFVCGRQPRFGSY